jgi:aminopeptidase N
VKLDGAKPDLFVLTQDKDDDTTKRLFSDTRRMLEFFEEKSGVPFPEPAYAQLLVDGGDAQESAAHSIIGHDNIDPILNDPHEDWVIAHELAHQWWGNSLTCADWKEAWLNEGVTVFMVAAYKEQRWGKADYDRELDLARTRWKRAKDEGFDNPLSWQGKYPTLRLMRAIAYAKSVIFLDTLRRELDDETFWRALRDYTRGHRGKTVTAQDFKASFERTASRDLTPLFDEWVFGPPPTAPKP